MLDEKMTQQSNEDEVAIPSPRPVYSAKDYIEKRAVPPPPPPNGVRPSNARERAMRRYSTRRNSVADWAWVVIAGTVFAVVIVVSFGAFILVQSANANVPAVPTAEITLPTAVAVNNDYSNVIVDDTLVLDDGTSIELVPWDGQSRFTMVLAGLDRRVGESGIAYRTDTMMIVSIDPSANSIGILSLPRDLYVVIQGYASRQRVNSALVYGELERVPRGPQLMMQTVQNNFGIRINDYLLVDFQAFIDVVDAIGGIDVTIDYTINDPQYPNLSYGYDPFYLAAGTHHLNGYNALRFARTRHGDSDIRRAERQQQTIFAIRDRILDLEMVPSLLAQSPALWASWQDNIYTGLSFEQMIQLALYIKDVPRENITTGVIDYQYLQSWSTPEGASVLIPNNARLPQLMSQVFGENYNR